MSPMDRAYIDEMIQSDKQSIKDLADFKEGVENSDGTLKYEDTWDFDFAMS